jgi:hypothetical protein
LNASFLQGCRKFAALLLEERNQITEEGGHADSGAQSAIAQQCFVMNWGLVMVMVVGIIFFIMA